MPKKKSRQAPSLQSELPAPSRANLPRSPIWVKQHWWLGIAVVCHFIIAAQAASTKSATFDEPVHLLGGMLQWRYGDYRVNPEHPPLWKHLVGIATVGSPLSVDLEHSDAQSMLANVHAQEKWAIEVLFRSQRNDGVQLIDCGRLVMPIFGGLVVSLVGLWASQIAGRVAGVVATWLAALDPNLLAHSGLITNDVACTASLLACFYFAWRFSRCASLVNIAAFCLACGVAACIKFTCLALPAMLAPVAILRFLDRTPWTVCSLSVVSGGLGRLAAITAVVGLAAVTSCVSIWAGYGFRYLPSQNPTLKFDTDFPVKLYGRNVLLRKRMEAQSRMETPPESMEVDESWLQTFCQFAHRHRLFPQAYLQGLAYAQAMSFVNQSYIDRERTVGGTISYFPRAWLYKTPIVVILSVVACCTCSVWMLWRGVWNIDRALLHLTLPYCVLIALAVTYDMNIGIRHLLPAYPLMWIGVGVVAGKLLQFTKRVRFAIVVLCVLVAAESLYVHPNYIAFFNLIARGRNHGLDRLSDSNLDWGQDLKELALWQRENRRLPLYLSYFGSADPRAYGIDYINTPPGYFYGPATVSPNYSDLGFLAISATWLQGAYIPDPDERLREEMDMIRLSAVPIAVLGGTIYIYELPLQLRN